MSNNIGRTEVAAASDNKYIFINDSDGRIDAAITEFLSSDYTSADVTLTTAQFQQAVCFRAANLSTARVLTVPDDIPKLFVVDNTGGSDTLTVTKNSTTVVVAAGATGIFYTDGTTDDLVQISGGSGAATLSDWKNSVRGAATGNVDIANDLEDGDSLDGLTLATGDRVLLPAQSSAAENGVYVVPASGAASRAEDFDEAEEITLGAAFWIEEGTANAEMIGILTAASADPVVVDTSTLTFTLYDPASGGSGGAAGFEVETETSTSYTVDAADAFKWKRLNNASAITATVDPQASSSWSDDDEIVLQQVGAGAVTIAAGAGVTLNVDPLLSLTLAGQYSLVHLKRTASDTWTVTGALAPTNDKLSRLWENGSNVASATSVDLSGLDGDEIHITGTTTITEITDLSVGQEVTLVADAAWTLEHDGSDISIPGDDDVVCDAGSRVRIRCTATDDVEVLWAFSNDGNNLLTFESGTFTPTLTFSTPGNLSGAYTNQNGAYQIAEGLMYCTLYVFRVMTHSTASGGLLIGGIPIAASVPHANATAYLASSYVFGVDHDSGDLYIAPFISNGVTLVGMNKIYATGGVFAVKQLTVADITSGASIIFGTTFVVQV